MYINDLLTSWYFVNQTLTVFLLQQLKDKLARPLLEKLITADLQYSLLRLALDLDTWTCLG